MNPLDSEAMKIMIPIMRKHIPIRIAHRITHDLNGDQPPPMSKEDMWRMCIAVEMLKKDLP